MTEKRFTALGDTHLKDNETGKEFYAPCEWDLLDLLNALNDENQKLRNDNLKAFALLGTIRALLRLDDTKECIDKINKFEKEIME